MIHKSREYQVREWEGIAAELAGALTESSWTLCTGFVSGGVYYLNDSFGEDSAQEWALLIQDGMSGTYDQIESVTFSWIDKAAAEEHILAAHRNFGVGREPKPYETGLRPKITTDNAHVCHLCR